MKTAFEQVKDSNNLILVWWFSGRTVLLAKTKDLTDENNYRPIMSLNTSYKLLTDLVCKYMREHTMENGISDEGQLGAVVEVLGTVDQLIIDRSIMEEVKTYHQNLDVVLYYYKKSYDKVHHDRILRVYKWIRIPDNVITRLISLMRKWKTRLKIWKDPK